MQVPFFEWSKLYLEDRENYLDLIDRTLSKGGFILQQDVADFEAKIRAHLDIEHAIGVSDGTNAILLGLRASGIGPGDEILLPSHAFIAAAQSIHFSGAKPVIVDIDPDDWLLSAESIEANITEQTTAIMPVHVNGRLCNMEKICEVAERRGLRVFEDAAQALGARFDGAPAGYFGEWATFSFYPSKTLGSFGDAGGLVTRHDDIAEKVMSMRNHGADENKMIPTDIDVWGTNCRLDNLHAAILSYKMDHYERDIGRRRQIAKRFHDAFVGISAMNLPEGPEEAQRHYDVFQNYEIRTKHRDALRKHLADNGVGTIIQWGGLALHDLTGLGIAAKLEEATRFFEETMLLPMNHMLTDEQVDYVIETVQQFFSERDE